MTKQSLEQDARDILQRLEHPRAQELTAGDVVELANILNERSLLRQLLSEFVKRDGIPDPDLLRRSRHALMRFEESDRP